MRQILCAGVTERNLNLFSRFDDLQATVDKAKAKAYFEAMEGKRMSSLQVNISIQKLLGKFILSCGIDIVYPAEPTQ